MSDIVVASSLPLQRSFFSLIPKTETFPTIFYFLKNTNHRLDHGDPKCTLDFRLSLGSALCFSPRRGAGGGWGGGEGANTGFPFPNSGR